MKKASTTEKLLTAIACFQGSSQASEIVIHIEGKDGIYFLIAGTLLVAFVALFRLISFWLLGETLWKIFKS